MAASSSRATREQDAETRARELAAALVRNFAAVDDVLQAQYAQNSWTTPDQVADRLESEIATRLLDLVRGRGPALIRDLRDTLAQAGEGLGRDGHLDPWDVLAFRAPVDFRSHRVVVTDPPVLSADIRAVQAKLLRRGVAVLGEHVYRDQRVLEVSSYDPERAQAAVRDCLPEVEVDWVGKTTREIRPVRCAGWRDKGDDLIRVWVSLQAGEHIDEVVVAESDQEIAVLAYACSPAAGLLGLRRHEPVGIYLERTLGDRVVVDGCSGKVIPRERSA